MNVLLVATSSYAGMGPYASSIINSLLGDDTNRFYFLLIEDERSFYSVNIVKELLNRATVIKRANTKKNKLHDLFFYSKNVSEILYNLCREKKIGTIHFLTSDSTYSKLIINLSRKYNVLYTVHDLHPHEAKKVFYKMWRHKAATKKVSKIILNVNNLVTNSRLQVEDLKKEYPYKNIFFHPFPSLVSDSVKYGNYLPSEHTQISKPYILFFGRVEQYKGVELLYNAFISDDYLSSKYQLVIAGGGDVYFDRDLKNEKNILFLNRYIKDGEISYLYRNSKCVIYPYISASQSGVISLACYFQTPILSSDVPYFYDVDRENIGFVFRNGSQQDLLEKLKFLLSQDNHEMRRKQDIYYLKNYDSKYLRTQLLNIYSLING